MIIAENKILAMHDDSNYSILTPFRVEELRWVKLLSKQWFGKFRKNLV